MAFVEHKGAGDIIWLPKVDSQADLIWGVFVSFMVSLSSIWRFLAATPLGNCRQRSCPGNVSDPALANLSVSQVVMVSVLSPGRPVQCQIGGLGK